MSHHSGSLQHPARVPRLEESQAAAPEASRQRSAHKVGIWFNRITDGLVQVVRGRKRRSLRAFSSGLYTYFLSSPPFICSHTHSVPCPLQRGLLPGHHHWHGTHYEHVHCWTVWRHRHGESLLLLSQDLHLVFLRETWFYHCGHRSNSASKHSPGAVSHRKGVRCLLEAHSRTCQLVNIIYSRWHAFNTHALVITKNTHMHKGLSKDMHYSGLEADPPPQKVV